MLKLTDILTFPSRRLTIVLPAKFLLRRDAAKFMSRRSTFFVVTQQNPIRPKKTIKGQQESTVSPTVKRRFPAHKTMSCKNGQKNKRECICTHRHTPLIYPSGDTANYFTSLPGFTSRSSEVTANEPSKFSALSIMPSLTRPFLNWRGAKLAMNSTCLPTSSSGA